MNRSHKDASGWYKAKITEKMINTKTVLFTQVDLLPAEAKVSTGTSDLPGICCEKGTVFLELPHLLLVPTCFKSTNSIFSLKSVNFKTK